MTAPQHIDEIVAKFLAETVEEQKLRQDKYYSLWFNIKRRFAAARGDEERLETRYIYTLPFVLRALSLRKEELEQSYQEVRSKAARLIKLKGEYSAKEPISPEDKAILKACGVECRAEGIKSTGVAILDDALKSSQASAARLAEAMQQTSERIYLAGLYRKMRQARLTGETAERIEAAPAIAAHCDQGKVYKPAETAAQAAIRMKGRG